MQYWAEPTGWVSFWGFIGPGEDSTPILESIALPEGTDVMFRFRGHGATGGSASWCTLDWTLHDLVITAHGDVQELTPSTWGQVKAGE